MPLQDSEPSSVTPQSGTKRKRTLSESSHTGEPVRSPDYWFEDGNIVLQAENTQFRIHKGILARHSSVFKDMVGIPQPSTSEEDLVEGCPLVRLSDAAKDWTNVLSIIYDYNA